MKLLGDTDDTFVPAYEMCKAPKDLVSKLYEMPDFIRASEENKLRGIKCPSFTTDLGFMSAYIYKGVDKFIIGVRHPIKWFESFYNFRANQSGGTYAPAEEKIGGKGGPFAVNTDRSRFHISLSKLGKTPLSEDEKLLLKPGFVKSNVQKSNTTIFIYDVDQLNNDDNVQPFRAELQRFLDLDRELPELPHVVPGANRTGVALKKVTKLKIDICQERYDNLRNVLLENGKQAQEWILKYFIESDDVTVPLKNIFIDIVKNWANDPCSTNDYSGRRSASLVNEMRKLTPEYAATPSTL